MGGNNESETREFNIIGFPPYTNLNNPANDSNFLLNRPNITINATVYYTEPDPITTLIYGTRATDISNIYKYLIYKGLLSNGTNAVYNFTTLPVDPASPGLVLLMHFDNDSKYENDTYSYDWSGNNNNGTWYGGVSYNTINGSKFGYAVDLDGIDDYINLSSSPSANIIGEVTVAAWIRLRDNISSQKIAGRQRGPSGGYKLAVYRNDTISAVRVEFEISGGGFFVNRNIPGGTFLNKGELYHVVGVYSNAGDYIRTYVNGVLDREM